MNEMPQLVKPNTTQTVPISAYVERQTNNSKVQSSVITEEDIAHYATDADKILHSSRNQKIKAVHIN